MVGLITYRDDDGNFVRHGDQVRFSYGIPPVGVEADLVEEDGDLVALTPGHNPDRVALKSLRRFVGGWWKINTTDADRWSKFKAAQ